MAPKEEVLLELRELQKEYLQGGQTLKVLASLNLTLHKGQVIALVGHSGSGKSTLLHMAGLLDTPTQGEVRIKGRSCGVLGDEERTWIRREVMGFVYQYHHLLPEFSALENVMIPQLVKGKSKKEAKKEGERLLEQMGLGSRLSHRPAQLSGGEQQRVAICRALANNPEILLADEPTGNLDPETSEEVFNVLLEGIRRHQRGALLATHNLSLAKRADIILSLDKGTLKLYNDPREKK